MKKKELISIIIPVYNVEQYLKRCVDSVINQTYKNIEILLIDDGSTDNSGQLCDDLSKTDNRIKVYHKKNGGLSDARNYGLDRFKGTYVTFVDSDDDITDNYIEILYKNIIKYSTVMSICAYSIVRNKHVTNIGKGYIEEKLNTKDCLSRMFQEKGFTVSACAKMFHKSLFKSIRFPRGKLYEDNGTIYKLILGCDYVSYSNKSVYNYYIRNNSITNEKYTLRKKDYIYFTDEACVEILKKYPDLYDICEARKVTARFCILRQMLNTNLSENEKVEEQKIILFLKKRKNEILKNKYVSMKSKISLISLLVSKKILKIGANVYERFK